MQSTKKKKKKKKKNQAPVNVIVLDYKYVSKLEPRKTHSNVFVKHFWTEKMALHAMKI